MPSATLGFLKGTLSNTCAFPLCGNLVHHASETRRVYFYNTEKWKYEELHKQTKKNTHPLGSLATTAASSSNWVNKTFGNAQNLIASNLTFSVN